MQLRYLLVPICLAVVLFFVYERIDFVFQFGKEINFQYDEECVLLPGIVGAEDSAEISPGLILFSSDDRMTLWETTNGMENVKNGSIALLYQVDDITRLEHLELHKFPSSVAFHPHGIHLLKKNDSSMLLFVINHAYSSGGERIDVFQVELVKEILPVSLTFLYTVGNSYFSENSMGVLNDIVSLSEGEFFVTQFLPFPDSVNGRKSNLTLFLSQLFHTTANMFALLSGQKWTFVRHCTYSIEEAEDFIVPVECNIVASGTSYNGINRNRAGTVLLVSDPVEHEIHAYRLTRDGKELELLRCIELPHSVDNIILDESTGYFFLGSIIGSISSHMERIRTRTDNSVENSFQPGGATQLHFDDNSYSYTFRELISHDGSLLSSVAVACPFIGNKVVLGSWEDSGLLICPIRS